MHLPRLAPEPGPAADFFQEGLEALGAVCERSWHDRLEVVTEGAAARLWREDGGLHAVALQFLAGAGAGGQDAGREVFPGCPLTFRLAEALRPSQLPLERFVLAPDGKVATPAPDVAEKLWHAQHPGTTRWRLTGPLAPMAHFSLVASLRCEVQAIDQHWSLHRLAFSLPNGGLDDALASALGTAAAGTLPNLVWPAPDPTGWRTLLDAALRVGLEIQLQPIRQRQQRLLDRELGRVTDYFDQYEAELSTRSGRARGPEAEIKLNARLAAARAEREHRRRDQIARHEIRVVAHLDALLLVAEPAWSTRVACVQNHVALEEAALFVPRARRWLRLGR